MRIAKLKWAGVSGLSDGALDFARDGEVPADLVVVTGPPGSGKTRLLEGVIIAGKERVAAYGPAPRVDDVLPKGGEAAKIAIEWWLSADERAFVGVAKPLQVTEAIYARSGSPLLAPDPAIGVLLERYDHEPRHGKVDYIPADRGLPSYSAMVGNPVFDQRGKRLSRGPDKYAGMQRLVGEALLRNTDSARLEAVKDLFSKLCPHLRLGGVSEDWEVEITRSGRGAASLSRLSASERQAFAIASSLVFVGVHHSVVLFDTPELHLSGSETRRWLDLLRAFAPTNQWIVATNAQEVVAMVGEKTLVRLGEPQ
ncbi:MAG: ATP-binding protein [Polyangiaceae bacterium]|nr:ATP-binding protein [Polyangiaceae bacterium]